MQIAQKYISQLKWQNNNSTPHEIRKAQFLFGPCPFLKIGVCDIILQRHYILLHYMDLNILFGTVNI